MFPIFELLHPCIYIKTKTHHRFRSDTGAVYLNFQVVYKMDAKVAAKLSTYC